MTQPRDFEATIRKLGEREPHYASAAYHFMLEALEHTMRWLGRDQAEGTERHVRGRELLEGIRRYSIETFGPMATLVFETWGIRRTEDFGRIVFNLVDEGLLSRQDSDTLEDFADGFKFADAFESGYKIELREPRA